MYDLIIIGGGPAGITAGIYAARQKLNTLLITKSFEGQIAKKAIAIENYPGFDKISGLNLIKKLEKQLRKFKIEIKIDSVIKVKKNNKNFFVSTDNKDKFQTKTIIVASGSKSKLLGVFGEKKFTGRGVSYCVVCDGPLFEGKTVVVIGGGNSGFEAAIFLSKIAKKIYILEYNSEISADAENQEIVRKTRKVEIITNVVVRQIKGNQFVNSIIYQDRKTGKEKALSVEGVFIEIGSKPAALFVKELVDINKKGEIKINSKTNQTKTDGFFAAGDITEIKEKQIIIAAGEGARAALSASRYLMKNKQF